MVWDIGWDLSERIVARACISGAPACVIRPGRLESRWTAGDIIRMTPPSAPAGTRYRLVTRSDFDGLVCAALLQELDILEDTLFVHPEDVRDGKVQLTQADITRPTA
jgi:hypothetical protein